MFRPSLRRLFPVWVAAAMLLPSVARACPFCSAVSQTFTEEINTVQVAVIAKLVEQPPPAKKTDGEEPLGALSDVAKTKFEIVQVLKGQDALGKTKQIEVLYFGQQPKNTKFLILGIEPPDVSWNAPVPLTERAVTYIGKLLSLPEKGADRLVFFQDYFEDSDELLARDAYDEFAKAPYSEVKELKPRMKREQLLKWIQDKDVLASRRRLYLTMLGVCGTNEDVAALEEMITREEPNGEPKTALDALIACYLTLKGPEGMPLVEERFLKNDKAEYTDTYSAIMALRFHGQEEDVIPKERLVQGLRHMLDRPQMADLVIPDLARWQDWESMDKLVKLFKESDEKSSWVRVPVVQFLKACPLPKAQEHIDELAKIDPDSVKRASFFVPLGSGAATAQAKPALVPAPEEKSEKKTEKPAEGTDSATVAAAAKPATDTAKPETETAKPAADTAKPENETADKATQGDEKPAASVAAAPNAAPPGDSPKATSTSAAASAAAENEENSLWIIFVPLGVGIALLVLLLIIVRGSGHAATEVKP